jgi:hypothetical protein
MFAYIPALNPRCIGTISGEIEGVTQPLRRPRQKVPKEIASLLHLCISLCPKHHLKGQDNE